MAKFSTGEIVRYTPDGRLHPAATGGYRIVRVMPQEGGYETSYRVRNEAESYERVANESELSQP